MSNIILQGLTLEQLQTFIKEAVNEALNETEAPQPTEQSQDDFITINEACELLSISRATLWRYEKLEKVKVYGIGGRRLLKKSELLEAITSKI